MMRGTDLGGDPLASSRVGPPRSGHLEPMPTIVFLKSSRPPRVGCLHLGADQLTPYRPGCPFVKFTARFKPSGPQGGRSLGFLLLDDASTMTG